MLLERVRAEKKRLIKEGKVKPDKHESYIYKRGDSYFEKVDGIERCIDDEIPFEIPESWEWVRFPTIADFKLGKTPNRHTDKYWINSQYSWFSISDMQDKKEIKVSKEKISQTAFAEVFGGVIIPKGTLLMSFKLTIGKTSILGIDALHNEAIISIFPHITEGNITRDFLFNLLGLLVSYVKLTDAIKGATLNANKLIRMLIPCPPIAEQKRIVQMLDILMI